MPTDNPELTAIVLAAGQGTRMRSALPKPLHEVCGRSMLGHVLVALVDVAPTTVVVVVGRGADAVVGAVEAMTLPFEVVFAVQAEQLGTGDAVRVALDARGPTRDESQVVVLPGDAPLLRGETLQRLVRTHRSSGDAATVATARLADPTGYGRIIRGVDGRVVGIVEQADASAAQAAVDEVNTSMYCFERSALAEALGEIRPDNAQGEWYLTDVVGVLAGSGRGVSASVMDDPADAAGVNDRAQLVAAGAVMRARVNDAWLRAGVTIVDPATTYIGVDVDLRPDVTIHPGAVLGGATTVGGGAVIGPHATVDDASIGAGAHIGASAVIGPGVYVEEGSSVPPLEHVGADRAGSA